MRETRRTHRPEVYGQTPEQKRKNFIRASFHQDIDNIEHYDLIINTARTSLDTAVAAIIGTTIGAQADGGFEKENSFILRKRK